MEASDSILGEPGIGRGRRNPDCVGTFAQMFLSGGDCLAQGLPSRQALPSFPERKSLANEFLKLEVLFGKAVPQRLRGMPKGEARVQDIDEQRVACEVECSERDCKGELSLRKHNEPARDGETRRCLARPPSPTETREADLKACFRGFFLAETRT